MQIAKPAGALSKKKKKKKGEGDTLEGGTAFRIGVKLHSDISVACSQPTDWLSSDTHVKSPGWSCWNLFAGAVKTPEQRREGGGGLKPFTSTWS